jgi:molybdenum cofactor biosynthesis enzyme MoaA
MYCPAPFNHTSISTDGYYNVCCLNQTPKKNRFHLNDGDFSDWQKNSYCLEVKQYFVDKKQHPGCHTCWAAEKTGMSSLRQRILKEYEILGGKEFDEKLLNIEISVGNLCNLSCLMCAEQYSSAILSENIKLKINNARQADFKWHEENFVNLYKNLKLKPRVINLRGGEPLYNKKIFEILDSFNCSDTKHTVIHITTNGTVWNGEWARVLSKFKLVRIMFSVDAVGDLYNYIRYPGNFTTVEQNIQEIIKQPNIKPLIYATVQNLNILYLQELIEWANGLGIFLGFDTVSDPDFLQFTNLPTHLKIKAIDNLKILADTAVAHHIQSAINSYITVLNNSLNVNNSELWEKFIKNITPRDTLRGNTYKQFLN